MFGNWDENHFIPNGIGVVVVARSLKPTLGFEKNSC